MASNTPPGPSPTPRKRKRRSYGYYLEDHPILGPVLTLLLGGFCLYASIFSTLLRDVLIGPAAVGQRAGDFSTATGWLVAFVCGIMFLAMVFLGLHLVENGVRLVRRRPQVCPRCGTAEVPRTLRFAHQPVEGTSWESVTCPQCGHSWHARR